ncbi:endonuclease/exonuclease/phosphatase family protein [Chlorobium phaeovibrioides]|uniref:Endonuclease/exonuclease/phosphatase family protein n=2 Tax=Chlorobium phaeovibrioides TaxID=1094 RepID=A0ABW9ULZ4_CHLPH|nr:endonuclease/exonuclease/phosphatase family protein [Chlorobium phaeovibrioides]
MQKIYSLLFLALLLFISHPFVSKANQPETEPLVFMWWNLENLFDTLDDPSTNDSDFTPSGKLHWTEKKLKLKQMRIAFVISAIEKHPDYRRFPDIVAVCEVENEVVLKATMAKVPKVHYKTLHHDSPDIRGIDVGLAYNPKTLAPTGMKTYCVPLEGRPTRDIVVAGFTAGGRPLHLVLNHWPSRAFDTRWTEKKRIAAATVARAIVDSLLQRNPQADIILMGDFNDEPGDRSLKETLGSSFSREQVLSEPDTYLYNCWDGHDGEGSYRYRGHWEQIDQMLVSSGMLQKSGLRLDSKPFSCFAISPMFPSNSKYPWRTYEKGKYSGGYSDHLPLLLKVRTSP